MSTMIARPLNGLLWVLLLLVAPVRTVVEILAAFAWPSWAPFQTIASLDPRWLPFTALVVVAYFATGWAVNRLVPRLNEIRLLTLPHPPDGLTASAMALTIVWLIAAALTRTLTVPGALVALVVLHAIRRGETMPVVPRPAPEPLPTPPRQLPEAAKTDLPDAQEDDTHFYRSFSWLFEKAPQQRAGPVQRCRLDMAIPRRVYDQLKKRTHHVTNAVDLVEFANAELEDEVVATVAARLRDIALSTELDVLAEIHLTMAFTLALRYALDEVEYGGEYPKFPVETLVDQRGDCEDHAILCGAALYRLGHPVCLVLMDFEDGVGHAALAVAAPQPIPGVSFHSPELGQEVFYCEVTPPLEATTETTSQVQWWLGMHPPAGAKNFRLLPIGVV